MRESRASCVAVEGVEELGVTLISNQFSMSTGVFTSAFPKKYTFPRPIIASSITVQPVEYEKKDPNDMRPLGPSPLQLQLHGNTHGKDPCQLLGVWFIT